MENEYAEDQIRNISKHLYFYQALAGWMVIIVVGLVSFGFGKRRGAKKSKK